MKIRYYEVLCNRYSKKNAYKTVTDRLKRLTGFGIYKHTKCKIEKIKTVEKILRIRLPVKGFSFWQLPYKLRILVFF